MAVKTFTQAEKLTAADTNTYLANGGLVYVASGSLSLTTSASNVTGVFDATKYKNYRLILNRTATSTSNRVDFRFLVGTTPTSSAYYAGGIGCDFAANTVIYAQRSNGGSEWFGQTMAGIGVTVVDVFNPNKADRTLWTGFVFDSFTGVGYTITGNQVSTNLFTGFQLFTSTGTATVEYQVFGYREA
jgi:hypothetical protein